MSDIRKSRPHNVIMIADDDAYVRQLIRRGLHGMAEVVEEGDGNAILRTYAQCKPNMLLLDIHMPQVHGPSLIPQITASDPDAYIIMISADAIRDNILHCLNAGAKGFIAKPFSRTTLLRDFYRCPTIQLSDYASQNATSWA